jgi:carbamoyl-phosphate synthase large subunit
MNVLITSASRKVGLIKAFQHALSINGGGEVIAADINPLSPTLYIADDYQLVPKSDNPEFIDTIIDICERLHVKLVIPTRDEELPLFAVNKEKFNDIGTVVMVSDPDTIEVCQDKELFTSFCQKNNFNIPLTYTNFEDLVEDDFPLFVKPKHGKGGLQAFKVNNLMEFKLIMNFVDDPVIQEFIDAREYTVDLFSDFEGNVISAVPRERISVWGGESLVTKTFKNPVIMGETVRLAMDLNLMGHNTIQCFFSEGIVKFIEVNPRFGGAARLSFAAGAHSPGFLLKLVKGEFLSPRLGDFKDGYIALRFVEDMFIDEDSIK